MADASASQVSMLSCGKSVAVHDVALGNSWHCLGTDPLSDPCHGTHGTHGTNRADQHVLNVLCFGKGHQLEGHQLWRGRIGAFKNRLEDFLDFFESISGIQFS
ncbi:unnamed protein product [Cladocopium goreaui]|uniref:Uncharacterized protein n=1 Tax=Cladocopium goreaui TaxID=2562237 RepID=A0A9P1BZ03_9DINO|nr:unnamed protein product [Cladocopium goreaui]